MERIRDVWASNLEEEMAVLRELCLEYPFIAMDTEFPGVVARPLGNFKSTGDYHYQTLRCNVDLLKLIQLGLTFSNENGELPEGVCTWQFNFKFSLTEDMYAQDSIDLLTRSGIDFARFENEGIDVEHFGEVLMDSGLVLADETSWLAFHSGYDFGYLLKTLTCKPLPAEEKEFFEILRLFFPGIYDIKFMMKFVNMKGGLQDIADDLKVKRIGPQHQAGSDSLLTSSTFFEMKKAIENIGEWSEDKIVGRLYNLSEI